MAYVVESFLGPEELIVGLIHGTADRCAFTCECHEAAVVYTTRSRLVCMSCGYTHLVLQEPLHVAPRAQLSAEDWAELFDHDGNRRHEEVDLAIVDFRSVEHAASIWQTDRWEHAARDFMFFARTPPDELAAAIRGTELDPSVLAEAGFAPVATPPPPAVQLDEGSIDVDLIINAGHATASGVHSLR